MKIKIISDGSSYFTKVINAETGENLPVVAVKWEMDIRDDNRVCKAWMLLDGVEIEADGLKVVTPPMVMNLVEVTAVGSNPLADFADEEE